MRGKGKVILASDNQWDCNSTVLNTVFILKYL